MKINLSHLLASIAAAALLTAPTIALTQDPVAATRPVGYMTLTVENGEWKLLTAPLTPQTLWQGPVGASGSSTIQKASEGEGWVPGAYDGQFILIRTGDGQGRIYQIDSNTVSTLEILAGDLSGVVEEGDTVEIFETSTIGTLLPNGGGLATASTGTPDTLALFNGVGWDSYRYLDVGPLEGQGWYRGTTFANNQPIFPGEGMLVFRAAPGQAKIVINGNVPDIALRLEIPGQASAVVGNPFPKEVTILDSGIQNTPNWHPTDKLALYRNGGWVGFQFLGGTWYQGTTPSNGTIINAGEAFLVMRTSSSGENWSALLPIPYEL